MVHINNIEVIKVTSIDKESNHIYLSRRQAEFNETNRKKVALYIQNM